MSPPLSRLPRRARTSGIIIPTSALLAVLLLAGTASLGLASHVEPVVTHNNAECDNVDGGVGWRQLVIEDSGQRGPHTDGVLVVWLDSPPAENSPAVVDWSSNIGVEGLILRGGQTGDNFYRYVPPATSDTAVTPDDSGTSQISNLLFCYLPPTPNVVPPPAVVPNTAAGPDIGWSPPAVAFALIAIGSLLALPVRRGYQIRPGPLPIDPAPWQGWGRGPSPSHPDQFTSAWR